MNARPFESLWRLGLVILGVCVALGLVEAAQIRLGAGEVVEASWWLAVVRVVPTWVLLAVLSPFVVWASDRWPIRGMRWRSSLAVHMALAVPFSLMHLALVSAWGMLRPGSAGLGFSGGMAWLASRFFVYDALSYGALVGVVHAFRYHREATSVREEADALVAQLEQARRQAVEGKLHPHFVFNTLNAIMGLASRGDQVGVVRTLEAFSELLQATLDDRGGGPVPFRDEVELLRRYLEIQQVRFGARLEVSWFIAPETLDVSVPGLVLQPLVENALSHAIGRSRDGGTIVIRSEVEGGALVLSVEDSGATDLRRGRDNARARVGRGIGLTSTRARLFSLYGDEASLVLAPRPGAGTVATVTLPRGG